MNGHHRTARTALLVFVIGAIGTALWFKNHFESLEPGEYLGPSLPAPSIIPHAGDTVTALALSDLDGKKHTVGGLRARPLLLHFWASWCLPCVAELPSLEEAQAQFHTRGLDLVTIAMDDRAHAQEIVDRFHLTLSVLVPDGSPVDPVLAFGSGQGSVPYNALIDSSGVLVRRKVGTMEQGATGLLRWLDTRD